MCVPFTFLNLDLDLEELNVPLNPVESFKPISEK